MIAEFCLLEGSEGFGFGGIVVDSLSQSVMKNGGQDEDKETSRRGQEKIYRISEAGNFVMN